jgi:hypothetical protein
MGSAAPGVKHVQAPLPTMPAHSPLSTAQVARLQERLEGLGVDCEALLADIVAAGEALT